MSMPSPWASRVSWTRIGRARALISWSLPLPFGYSTTETSVIVPPDTLSWTCTGPQRVEASSPVTVVPVPEADDEPEEDVPSVDDVPSVEEVPPVPLATGATAEDSAPAAA